MITRYHEPTKRDAEYGVTVSANGYGVHVSTWSRGALSDLRPDEARTLAADLIAAADALEA